MAIQFRPASKEGIGNGFYSDETGFIPISSMKKASKDGINGYFNENTGFIPDPSEENTVDIKTSNVTSNPATQFFSGINKGISGIAGFPVDALNSALGAIGLGSDNPIMGSKWIRESVMPESMQPQNVGMRIIDALGEQTGSFVPALGMAYKAKNLMSTAKQTLPFIIGAGTASGLARELRPDDPAADIISQILGGGALKTTTNIPRLLSKVTKPSFERSMMIRALKPSETLSQKEIEARADTSLNEGIRVSKAGVGKRQNTIASINEEIKSRLSSLGEQGETANLENVIGEVEKMRANKVTGKLITPEGAQTQITDVVDEVIRNNPERIPIEQAQTFKQSINKELDDFYKAMTTSPDKTTYLSQQWTRKAKASLADGLRKEISNIFPEIKALNKREGSLIALGKSLDRTVNKMSISDLVRFKTLLYTAINPKLAVANFIFNNQHIQSAIAVAMRQARLKPSNLAVPATFGAYQSGNIIRNQGGG